LSVEGNEYATYTFLVIKVIFVCMPLQQKLDLYKGINTASNDWKETIFCL